MVAVVVCLKWVDRHPEIDPLTGAVSTDARSSGAGPADLSALEWGLRLAEATDGTVTVATVAPTAAETMLRDALAAGAGAAVHIRGSGDEPSRTVASLLATRCTDVDVVCCGAHSLDRGSGSVPAFLAHELGIPQALGLLSAATAASGSLTVERRLDQGRRERLSVLGRCVLSFERGPELRRASLAATLAATTAAVETVEITAPATPPGPEVVGRGPYRPRSKVKPAPTGATRERVAALLGAGQATASERHELGPSEAARLVVERLIGWGYLDEAGGDLSP